MLDIRVWTQKEDDHCKICHSFFQKETMSLLVFHLEGAHNTKSKIITLLEEFWRRLLHMDDDHRKEEKTEVIQDFLQKMTHSGYLHNTRREAIASACTKF